jgi:hypothetical protein
VSVIMKVSLWLWLCWTAVRTSWRERRGEEGDVTSNTAMIAILLVAAVAVGGIVYDRVTEAANNLSIDLPGGD